jgi:hypothetical protein
LKRRGETPFISWHNTCPGNATRSTVKKKRNYVELGRIWPRGGIVVVQLAIDRACVQYREGDIRVRTRLGRLSSGAAAAVKMSGPACAQVLAPSYHCCAGTVFFPRPSRRAAQRIGNRSRAGGRWRREAARQSKACMQGRGWRGCAPAGPAPPLRRAPIDVTVVIRGQPSRARGGRACLRSVFLPRTPHPRGTSATTRVGVAL